MGICIWKMSPWPLHDGKGPIESPLTEECLIWCSVLGFMYWKERQHSLNCVQTIDLHVNAKKMHSLWYFRYRNLKWCQIVCKNSGCLFIFIFFLFFHSSQPPQLTKVIVITKSIEIMTHWPYIINCMENE